MTHSSVTQQHHHVTTRRRCLIRRAPPRGKRSHRSPRSKERSNEHRHNHQESSGQRRGRDAPRQAKAGSYRQEQRKAQPTEAWGNIELREDGVALGSEDVGDEARDGDYHGSCAQPDQCPTGQALRNGVRRPKKDGAHTQGGRRPDQHVESTEAPYRLRPEETTDDQSPTEERAMKRRDGVAHPDRTAKFRKRCGDREATGQQHVGDGE